MTATERQKASQLSTEALVSGKNNTFDPNAAPVKAGPLTDEQKAQIKEMLANAGSLQEVEEIEKAVARGVMPKPRVQ